MQERRCITRAVAFFGILMALVAVALASGGCQAMRDLDKAIWSPTTSPSTDADQVDQVPPIVEIAAAIAALLGFGGMSTWVARSNKRTANGYKDLAERVAELESRVRSEVDGG